MYTPSHFAEPDDAVILGLVRSTGFGHLVCQTDAGLVSSPLPFVVDDELQSVRAHLARANPIWRSATGPALIIVAPTDAYISPGWYPSKAEHGKVVPTWNYEVVHLHGQITIHDDQAWIGDQIVDLTDHNEAELAAPWSVDDAPVDFIEKQKRAIVGIEMAIDRVEAKRKLSQNRSETDQDGVIIGLSEETNDGKPVADAMAGDGS